MKILDKLCNVLFPRQHRENTIDLPTEGKRVTEEPMTGWATDQQIEECFNAYQQGGRTAESVQGAQSSGQEKEGEVTPEGSQNNYPFDFTSSGLARVIHGAQRFRNVYARSDDSTKEPVGLDWSSR
jgi:hypothetical protein